MLIFPGPSWVYSRSPLCLGWYFMIVEKSPRTLFIYNPPPPTPTHFCRYFCSALSFQISHPNYNFHSKPQSVFFFFFLIYISTGCLFLATVNMTRKLFVILHQKGMEHEDSVKDWDTIHLDEYSDFPHTHLKWYLSREASTYERLCCSPHYYTPFIINQ